MVAQGPFIILVVEDDIRIRTELTELLFGAGFGVEAVDSVQAAKTALVRRFDLLLLDLGLPDGDGLDLCRWLREEGFALPVVVLTSRDAPSQKVRGLDVGADDYVTKPFHRQELLARVRAAMRRAHQAPLAGQVTVGELWADPVARVAGLGDRIVELPPREFELLYFLLQHPGRAWTRAQLIDRVWGDDFEGDFRAVDLCIRRLRTQIESDTADPRWIKTVWGVGYRMSDDTKSED